MNAKRAPNQIDKRVGSRLRRRRHEVNMSQEELARSFGVSFQQIQKYEKGINRLSSDRLYQAAIALGVPISYFFEFSCEDRHTALTAKDLTFASTAEAETFELSQNFIQIRSPIVRRTIVELVQILSEK